LEITNHHRSLIGLLNVPGLGLRLARQLLKQTGVSDASDIFNMSVAELSALDGIAGERARNIAGFDQWDAVDKILKKTERSGASLVSFSDPAYPRMLKQIYDPPMILWLKGSREALNKQAIAIVGTRNPGRYGLAQAEYWSRTLCSSGIGINSGLAYGIDARSHQTAVECGGTTVAVLGSGIDWIYPNKNKRLAKQITDSGGAVITEYPPGTKPDAVNFPERNRIVSGMSYGVLVVESGIKGGSMITARLALDQNREVFVVPHQLNYMKGEGCNFLIKMGHGKLIQSEQDIMEELSINPNGESVQKVDYTNQPKKWENESLPEDQQKVCRLLSSGSLHIDKLAEEVETEPFKLAPMLLELEMMGLIQQKAGKYFELK